MAAGKLGSASGRVKLGKWPLMSVLPLCVLLPGNKADAQGQDAVVQAFRDFFGEPMQVVLGSKEVKIHVNDIEEDPDTIPVGIDLDIPQARKVLMLKLPNTGYASNGYFNEACAKESVYVAGYVLNPQRDVSRIDARMHTYCTSDSITLLVWARADDGRYYSNSRTFKTTLESPG